MKYKNWGKSVSEKTDKQTTAYSYNEIPLSNKKDETTDTHNNTDDSQKDAEWKKPQPW